MIGIKRPPRTQSALVMGVIALALIGVLDAITGVDVHISFLYLIPVAVVAWFAPPTFSIPFSVLSVMVWIFCEELPLDRLTSGGYVPYINIANRLIFTVAFTVCVHILRGAMERERRAARIDFTTQIFNAQGFADAARIELDRSRRYDHPLSICFVDIDDFKKINDRYGHSTGNRVLRRAAHTMRDFVRNLDVVARLGGDEFVILMPETGSEASNTVVKKIKAQLAESMSQNKWPVTFSFGVVTFMNPPSNVDDMIRAADEIMYEAKKRGKNQIRTDISVTPGGSDPGEFRHLRAR